MLSRLGIGARLFIAFLGITALSLSSGVAGWLILRDISATQSRINRQALPAVAAAQRTAETSARLVATAPALNAVRDEASRAAQEAELATLAADIRDSVNDAGLSSLDSASTAKLSGTVGALMHNLTAQNRLVKERLQLQQSFAGRAERTIQAATAIVDLSETLVSNTSAGTSAVISGLYGLIDDPARREEAYQALDRLIEQDIYLLDRMWELRLRSSQIGLLANQLTRTTDRNEVAEIAKGYEEHLRVVRRRVASIDDPVRREQAQGFLKILEAASGDAPIGLSLFGERLRLIAIGDDLESVAEANRNLSAAVSQVAQRMLDASQSAARTASAQAQGAVDAGLYVLLALSLVAVALSGFIVWFYVERGIVRRLGALSGAMQKLTVGDLSVEVSEEGAKELRALSSAVAAFRDETKTRRALEAERERDHEELRRHREELQELVHQRTEELQQEVAHHAKARETAETASRAKSAFLATMSHEIRTPMTGMLGMLRILKEGTLSRQQHKHVTVAANSGETLLGILNSILDYSKIESGKITLDDMVFEPADLLNGVVALMRPAAEEKGLDLALTLGRKLGSRYKGDAGKLRQIVFNLLSNAIKFTESGGIAIKATMTGKEISKHVLRITVKDSGIGIAQDQRERIFESFTQTDASVTRRYGGTGLGLAISRGFARAMGGDISVTSKPGKGSQFTLEIAVAPATTARAARLSKTPPKTRAHAPLKVLVVEDDPATRLVARQFLEMLGHTVETASDGYEALGRFADMAPDLVLMDISLPGKDGIETAHDLRAAASHPGIPIIAMSAHVFKEEVERYLSSGMDAYVAKPLSPEALAQAIALATKERAMPIDKALLDADIGVLGAETMRRIFTLVEETLPKRFARMREALGSRDFAALQDMAHATCSTATSAGFAELCQEAQALERCAGKADPLESERRLAGCEAAYRRAIADAEEHFRATPSLRDQVSARKAPRGVRPVNG